MSWKSYQRRQKELQQLLMLLSAGPLSLRSVEARPTPRPELIPHDPVVRVFFNQKAQTDTSQLHRANMLFPIPDLQPHEAKVFRHWFSSAKRLKGIRDVFFGTLRVRPAFMDTRFFHLSQSLESFHRKAIQRSGKYLPRKEWRPILKKVKALVPDDLPLGITDAMRRALEWANDFSFPERLNALLGSLSPETVDLVTNDPRRFVAAIKDTRNWLTHLERRADSKAFPSDDWSTACDSMELLLFILMLKHHRVPENRIRDRVVECHRFSRSRYHFHEEKEPEKASDDA